MKPKTIAAAAALVLCGGAAVAQAPEPPRHAPGPAQVAPPPPPPPPPGEPRAEGRGPGMRGPHGGMPPHVLGAMNLGKGSYLRVEKDGTVTLKCAEEESTKACMEAVSPVIDKLRPAASR